MVEVGFSGNIPHWLDTLLKEEFYDPCMNHPASKQNFKKNALCVDCSSCFCNNCSPTHCGHKVLQIRKYNDDRVVKTEDIEKLIKCSKVQSYMLNRARVVFLKARSLEGKKKTESQEQPNERVKTPKQHYHTGENICRSCRSCSRFIKEKFDFCSVKCMVQQVLRTEGSILELLQQFLHLPSNLKETDKEPVPNDFIFLHLPLNIKEAKEQPVPKDLILRDPTASGSISNGTEKNDSLKRKTENNKEPSSCSSFRLHKRKGVPRRSPYY